MPPTASGPLILGRFNFERRTGGRLEINNRNELQMHLDILAGEQAIRQLYHRSFDFVVCFSKNLEALGFEDDHRLSQDDRKARVHSEFENRLFLCKHWLNRDSHGRDWLNVSELGVPVVLISADLKPEMVPRLACLYELPVEALPSSERRKLDIFSAMLDPDEPPLAPEAFALSYRGSLWGPLRLDAAAGRLKVADGLDLVRVTEADDHLGHFDAPLEDLKVVDERVFDRYWVGSQTAGFSDVCCEAVGRDDYLWCPRTRSPEPLWELNRDTLLQRLDEAARDCLAGEPEIFATDGSRVYGPYEPSRSGKVDIAAVRLDALKELEGGALQIGGHVLLLRDYVNDLRSLLADTPVEAGSNGKAATPVEPLPAAEPPAAPDLLLPPCPAPAELLKPATAELPPPMPRAPVHAGPEHELVAHLQRYVASQRFNYSDETLLDLHVSFKTGSLVVLSGLSGTGKSQLAELYANALGLSERNGRFLLVPVRPRWTDDDDLLGYYNSRSNLFEPGESGLVEFLRRAETSTDDLHLALLDEMNLSRVEHYFSAFFSLLERRDGGRKLRLYSPRLEGQCWNRGDFPPEVSIGPNLLFCGTVNQDETTQSLSDRLLDRANTLTFDAVDVPGWWSRRSAPAQPVPPLSLSAAQWASYIRREPNLKADELDLLDAINRNLQDAGLGFGYRVVEQIGLYLANIPLSADERPLIPRHRALDLQLCQRVLPKVRGTSEQLRPVLGGMEESGSPLETLLLDSGMFTVAHSRCVKDLRRKKRSLELHDHVA